MSTEIPPPGAKPEDEVPFTTVTEVQAFKQHHLGTPEQVLAKLLAMGWEVAEERLRSIHLRHDLIPGAERIISR